MWVSRRLISPATWVFVQKLFRLTTKILSKLCFTGPMTRPGKPSVLSNTGGFPTQRVSNAESVPMPRRHHAYSANSSSFGSISLESSYARAKTSDARPEPCQKDQIHPLKWRHNERDGVSNHQRLDGLTVFSGTDQRKYQSSVSLAFVRGIHRWPENSPHKGPVTRKMFPFDDVIMYYKTSKRCQIWYSWYEFLLQIIGVGDLMIIVA